jgi:hypothetical protein
MRHQLVTLSTNIISQPIIRVRIDPPHPFVCHTRRLNGAVLQMRPEKPRPRVTAGVAQKKTPPCSKALSAEHRSKFCSLSPVTVTYPYKWKIRVGRKTLNNQSIIRNNPRGKNPGGSGLHETTRPSYNLRPSIDNYKGYRSSVTFILYATINTLAIVDGLRRNVGSILEVSIVIWSWD